MSQEDVIWLNELNNLSNTLQWDCITIKKLYIYIGLGYISNIQINIGYTFKTQKKDWYPPNKFQ